MFRALPAVLQFAVFAYLTLAAVISFGAPVEIGTNDFRISDLGPDGNVIYFADNAGVAYNSTNNEFLVVWQGDDNGGSLVNEENEIWRRYRLR